MWCCKCSNIMIASVKRKRIYLFFNNNFNVSCFFLERWWWFLYSMAIILCNMYSYRPTDNCKMGWVSFWRFKALKGQEHMGASRRKCTAVVAWQLSNSKTCQCVSPRQWTNIRAEVGGAKAITEYVKPTDSFFKINILKYISTVSVLFWMNERCFLKW